jgi:hypothetical protein
LFQLLLQRAVAVHTARALAVANRSYPLAFFGKQTWYVMFEFEKAFELQYNAA